MRLDCNGKMVLFVNRIMVLYALLFGDISCIIPPVSEGNATGIVRVSNAHFSELRKC
jgi:hypothetical protein